MPTGDFSAEDGLRSAVTDVCSMIWYKFRFDTAAQVHYHPSINLIQQPGPCDLAAGAVCFGVCE